MTPSEHSQKHWNALLKRLRHEFPHAAHTPPASASTLPDLLVHGVLLWEASSHQAELAHQRLRAAFIDHNELRVSMADDIAIVLGDRYPLAAERAMRLRAVLNDIFAREHAVILDRLGAVPKRDARSYMLGLDGCPEFAAAYVLLNGLAGHAAPVDERLTNLLTKAGVFAPGTPPASVASWIEHYVHADECAAVHAVLRAWSDKDGHPPARERRHAHPVVGEKRPATASAQPATEPQPPRAAPKRKPKGAKGARKT